MHMVKESFSGRIGEGRMGEARLFSLEGKGSLRTGHRGQGIMANCVKTVSKNHINGETEIKLKLYSDARHKCNIICDTVLA